MKVSHRRLATLQPCLIWSGNGLPERKSGCPKSPDSVEEVDVLAGLPTVEIWGDTPLLHVGAGAGTSFASFLRFCAVAASWNCSYAPFGPRSRIIRTPMYRFR